VKRATMLHATCGWRTRGRTNRTVLSGLPQESRETKDERLQRSLIGARAKKQGSLDTRSPREGRRAGPAKGVRHAAHHSSCESIMSAPSSEVREAPKASFASIQPPLSPAILEFLSKPPYNFPSPTPVQDTTIPLFLTHHDVFVRAVTGSGKTRKTTF